MNHLILYSVTSSIFKSMILSQEISLTIPLLFEEKEETFTMRV